MAKKLHLICNAHLDPVWQWEWEEGAAEALSTFRIAADFCEEYENFVFCHNESLLYRWIEEYDMPLFEHIRALVKAGKWNIMGGWHLQPDCNMPSGEAFVRQILDGRKYFLEKFGVVPKVAVNLDPFGHTRGLVQILKKSGYDGYMFMRPDEGFMKLPAMDFKWVGYDGSEITATRIHCGYNSGKGKAVQKIRPFIDACKEDDFFLCLWGIGNHGGGPSKKDLDDITALSAEMQEKGVSLVHSNPESYLADVMAKRELPVIDYSLNPWSPGCYTSQIRVKQKYRQAENMYFMTESMCSHAAMSAGMAYPEKELAEAMYDIITVQFHDILPGSSIQPAEEMAIRMLDHALEILSRIRMRAFVVLASGQKKAPEDKIPIFAYNPYPYKVEGDFMCEFMLWDQHWALDFLQPKVYAADGTLLDAQCEKEHSTIPLEWRKRVVFHAELEPMTLNRFECGFETIPAKPAPKLDHNSTHYIFDRGGYHIEINRATGLVDTLAKDGVQYLKPGALALEVFEDDYDPWYMRTVTWKNKLGEFTLLSPEEAQILCHTDAPMEGVRVIESGDVRAVVEAVFGYNTSHAIVKYYLSGRDGLRMDVRVVWDEKQRMIKLNVPAAFGDTACIGEHAYGREELLRGLTENMSQKYTAICGSGHAVAVLDNGVYGSSFDDAADSLKITLMRSPSYTAHPLGERITMPQDRYMPYIEQGERDFSFGFVVGNADEVLEECPRAAQAFNVRPMLLSFYPTGVGEVPVSPVRLDGGVITLNALKKAEDGNGYIFRLHNPTGESRSVNLSIYDTSAMFTFGAYEIKSIRYNGTFSETDLMEGLID